MKALLIFYLLAADGSGYDPHSVPMPDLDRCEAIAKPVNEEAQQDAESGTPALVAEAKCVPMPAGDTAAAFRN